MHVCRIAGWRRFLPGKKALSLPDSKKTTGEGYTSS
jgi:hypothetical protein